MLWWDAGYETASYHRNGGSRERVIALARQSVRRSLARETFRPAIRGRLADGNVAEGARAFADAYIAPAPNLPYPWNAPGAPFRSGDY